MEPCFLPNYDRNKIVIENTEKFVGSSSSIILYEIFFKLQECLKEKEGDYRNASIYRAKQYFLIFVREL